MSDVSTEQRRVLDYELADEVRADTSARMKALGDPLRMAIVDLVLERAMTVTELAERLRRPKGSVAYHVNVLVEAGLLRIVRTHKVRAIDERYYGRVGRTIVFEHAPGEVPFLAEMVAEVDLEVPEDKATVGYTYRHARIPRERAQEYLDRLQAIALEFIDEPRDGDVEYGMYIGVFPTNRDIAPKSGGPDPQLDPAVDPAVDPEGEKVTS
jgi:DNA-binding transcriptional ArsR family regulator